jgi:hypothetical protein
MRMERKVEVVVVDRAIVMVEQGKKVAKVVVRCIRCTSYFVEVEGCSWDMRVGAVVLEVGAVVRGMSSSQMHKLDKLAEWDMTIVFAVIAAVLKGSWRMMRIPLRMQKIDYRDYRNRMAKMYPSISKVVEVVEEVHIME